VLDTLSALATYEVCPKSTYDGLKVAFLRSCRLQSSDSYCRAPIPRAPVPALPFLALPISDGVAVRVPDYGLPEIPEDVKH
jgi:hypothetical protein